MFCHNRQRIESLYFCRAPSEITSEINQGKSWKRRRQVTKEELKEHGISHVTIEMESCLEDCKEQSCLIKSQTSNHCNHHH